MIKFDRYKSKKFSKGIDFYFMIFNTRIKRIVFNSFAAFFLGAALTFSVFAINSRISVKKGVGGLETSGVPEFKESDFDSISEKETFKDAENISLSKDARQNGTEEAQLPLEAYHGDADADSEENARKLLALDETNSESPSGNIQGENLDLCYSTYRVKKGDMIGYIADNFNITQDTIISVNNIRSSRLLQIGQYLKIPSMPGIIYTVRQNGETVESIAKKYDISAEKTGEVNHLSVSASLNAGTTLFLPEAYLDWVTRQEINGDLFHKPVKARYWLSSYYGWRSSPFSGKRSYHSGVDMACPTGTPVYAALGGTVTSTGFNNVYGNYVIVTHHSGYKTLYGHMSAILVTRGKYVDTNTRIGKVGSTGLSTGPHLHFTVYKNGKTVDPTGLWK